jgi:glutamyl/glutaminyl-tRNA synthetase
MVNLEGNNLFWVGETHGISNNYLAYKHLIPELLAAGFKYVALEYPEELEQFTEEKFMKYSPYRDGRFSHESLTFMQWLQTTGLIVLCFDVRHELKSQQQGEDVMAENLMSKLTTDSKALVITGSLHGRRQPVQEVIPQAGLMEKAGYKIN